MSQENVEIVRRSPEAGDRMDYESVFADTRSDLMWIVAKEHPNSRTLHGPEEIVRYFDEWEGVLGHIRQDVAEYRETVDRVVAMGRWSTSSSVFMAASCRHELRLERVIRFQDGMAGSVSEG